MNTKFFYSCRVLMSLLFFNGIMAQEVTKDSVAIDSSFVYGDYIIFEGDTLVIALDEIHLLKRLKFKSNLDRRYYYWFRKKVHNAYPYAKMTEDRLVVINKNLKKIKSKRKRKRYTKRLQKYFEVEFTDQLKKLTQTEGRILIKLIHRQTGITTFEMIKDLRSGWKAFWYQQVASVFKLSIKNEYHPETLNEDYLIEDILQRAFNDLTLERQASKLDFDFEKLSKEDNRFIKIER